MIPVFWDSGVPVAAMRGGVSGFYSEAVKKSPCPPCRRLTGIPRPGPIAVSFPTSSALASCTVRPRDTMSARSDRSGIDRTKLHAPACFIEHAQEMSFFAAGATRPG
jgi:hypothetical protein